MKGRVIYHKFLPDFAREGKRETEKEKERKRKREKTAHGVTI